MRLFVTQMPLMSSTSLVFMTMLTISFTGDQADVSVVALPRPASVNEDPIWRLPVIIAGAIGGFLFVVIVIGACAYKRVSAQSPKANRTKSVLVGKDNTSPNHIVSQVSREDSRIFVLFQSLSAHPWLNFGLPPRCPQVVWCH